MNKNITVFGSNGMLGQYVSKVLRTDNFVMNVTRHSLDISQSTHKDIENFLHGCNIVINCAGIIKQRKNVSIFEMIKVNSVFPHILAEICEKKHIKLIHITTDCVYNGQGRHEPYTEKSMHNAFDIYGKTKSIGEPENACIIRTSVIGEKPNDFNSLLEWARSQSGKSIYGFVDHFWNGVTCLQLSNIIKEIIYKNIYWKGTRHVFSFKGIDKCNLLRYINSAYNFNLDIIPCKAGYTDRRLKSVFPKMFNIPSIQSQIRSQKDFNI